MTEGERREERGRGEEVQRCFIRRVENVAPDARQREYQVSSIVNSVSVAKYQRGDVKQADQ